MRSRVSTAALVLCLGALPLVSLGQSSAPSGKVGAVNLQKAILNTTEGREALAELEKKYQPRLRELQKLQHDIAAITQRLQKQSATLTEEQRRRLNRELEDKQAVLKRGTAEAQANFATERDEILRRIDQEMLKQIADYAQENGFSLIIASDRVPVYYAAKEAALTGEIIKRCQNQLAAKVLAKVLNWKPGSVVAEIGAGDGGLTLAAAERVGPAGRVYTTELDSERLADLKSLAAKQKRQNITVVKAGEAETNLPRECCDSIFMRGVYHHFTQPAKEDASLLQSLKPGGLLAVIDFPPGSRLSDQEPIKGVPKNRGGHGMPKQLLLDELSAAGFRALTTPTGWHGDDYCVVVQKPAP